MADAPLGAGGPLRILHILRAPVGGLFRHVVDVTEGQIRHGHRVGLVTDSSTGGEPAERVFEELRPRLALGLSRVPMRRGPHVSDLRALAHVAARIGKVRPDVVHGHGSKGGVFARLPGFLSGRGGPMRAYTPHGGSLNHRPGSFAHRAYMAAERVLGGRTDLLLFESAYIAARYEALVGFPRALRRVVHNGIGPHEFVAVEPAPHAAEFMYVGELRAAKGIDVFLEALAEAGRRAAVPPRAVLVGSGPDQAALRAHAHRLGLGERIEFVGPMPARRAFALGRTLVVPSRAESLPYIALEAAGARVPMIATAVGGIPEIFGPFRDRLIEPGDASLLATRMVRTLATRPEALAAETEALAVSVEERFSLDAMVDSVIRAYRDTLAALADRAMSVGPDPIAAPAARVR